MKSIEIKMFEELVFTWATPVCEKQHILFSTTHGLTSSPQILKGHGEAKLCIT